MLPGIDTGGGGFSGSSSASSRAGDVHLGSFTAFAPPSKIPTVAWIALGLAGAVLLWRVLR